MVESNFTRKRCPQPVRYTCSILFRNEQGCPSTDKDNSSGTRSSQQRHNISGVTMRLLQSLATFLFVITFFPNARAQQVQAAPGQFDYYLLNLSWAPEFCHNVQVLPESHHAQRRARRAKTPAPNAAHLTASSSTAFGPRTSTAPTPPTAPPAPAPQTPASTSTSRPASPSSSTSGPNTAPAPPSAPTTSSPPPAPPFWPSSHHRNWRTSSNNSNSNRTTSSGRSTPPTPPTRKAASSSAAAATTSPPSKSASASPPSSPSSAKT